MPLSLNNFVLHLRAKVAISSLGLFQNFLNTLFFDVFLREKPCQMPMFFWFLSVESIVRLLILQNGFRLWGAVIDLFET